MNNKIFGFRTKKLNKGFSFEITETKPREKKNSKGSFVDIKVIIKGTRSTRSQALGVSKRIVLAKRRGKNVTMV